MLRRPSHGLLGICRNVGALALLALIATACLSDEFSPEAAERQGFDNFKTAVAIPDRNYDIYWMGREFEAGGLTLRGPSVASFGNDVEGGGLGVTYISDCSARCADVELVLYSPDAWRIRLERRAKSPSPRFDRRDVELNGHGAELKTLHGDTLPITGLVMTIDYGDTVVEATTSAFNPATPGGPQPNPLIDEATFLAAMENLRPYPE